MIGVQPPDGQVTLTDKQFPICELPDSQLPAEGLCFKRGDVDITKLKTKLQNLPPEAWNDENQHGNVALKRPAHDDWGIKKIIFNFCDDFLLKVLSLPWSRLDEWRELLVPIYEAIGVKEHQVVRSLFASMPPNMSIPVHHDTGYWVKHTHRCHAAIVSSNDEVDFLVGKNEHSLQKMLFPEGQVIELNNQAKHAVHNRMKDTWRIHLIFDYVDEHPVTRIPLQPGERVLQTRRTIDLLPGKGAQPSQTNHALPTFVIIGAQKSGTTSLYEYICGHPMVVKGRCRESHYFDWRWRTGLGTLSNDRMLSLHNALPSAPGSGITTSSMPPTAPLGKQPTADEKSKAQAHRAHYAKTFFYEDALNKYVSLITGESTPSYLLHSDIVIPRMKWLIPDVKVIIILRNPVARAYSQYQMCVDAKGTPEQKKTRGQSYCVGKSFQQVVAYEMEELEKHGLLDATAPAELLERFQKRFLPSRPMTHGGHSLLARGFYSLQIESWLAHFPPSQIKILAIEDLQGTPFEIQHKMNTVTSFIGLRDHDMECLKQDKLKQDKPKAVSTQDKEAVSPQPATPRSAFEPKNTRQYEPLNDEMRETLNELYAPHHQRLVALLESLVNQGEHSAISAETLGYIRKWFT